MTIKTTEIWGCEIVPVAANRDDRGCLYEIYRQSWPHAFATVQWNACASNGEVVRGAHVHVDYAEFYTLPFGRVVIGLSDIRSTSPAYGKSAQFEWSARDDVAVVVPAGVVHVVMFEENSVLTFGLSGYWNAEYDVAGCQWNDPCLGANRILEALGDSGGPDEHHIPVRCAPGCRRGSTRTGRA